MIQKGIMFSGFIIMLLIAAITFTPYAVSSTSNSFINGVLPPPSPGSTSNYNQAAEPQVASAIIGTFYISSENSLGASTDAWESTNGGSSYFSLPQPNAISSAQASGTTGLAPGGGDTAVATASVLNGNFANSQYNVYVASLTLGSVTV